MDWRQAFYHIMNMFNVLIVAYFFLGNSYDNLFKPSRVGEAENDAYLQKAIQNYKLAAERETDPKMQKLSLEYLVAAYGPDKLNDPSQAEPIVKQMIEMEPNEPTNYFALAKIYEDNGLYDEAEATLLRAKDARPNDPTVYTTLAGYYNRQGEFDKTIEALEARATLEPENPEAFHTIATYYWDKAFRDLRLTDPEKRDYVLKGIDAADRAIAIKADYMEALTYKNLLLRVRANLEKDPKLQKASFVMEAEAEWEKIFQFINALYAIEGVLSVEHVELKSEGGKLKVAMTVSVLVMAPKMDELS